MNLRPKIALALLLVGTVFAPDASAGDKKHGYSKKSKHVGISIGFSKDWGSKPSHHPPHHAPPPRIWVPGHYSVVCEKTWIPGSERRIWVEPAFELRYDSNGRAFQFCVGGGHWKTICEPGHYEMRDVKVWTPGHWQVGHHGHGAPGY